MAQTLVKLQVHLAKSLKLENLLPILKMENIHFVDIQYDDTTEEIKKWKSDEAIASSDYKKFFTYMEDKKRKK